MAYAMTFGQADAKKSSASLYIKNTNVGNAPADYGKTNFDIWLATFVKIGVCENSGTHGAQEPQKVKTLEGDDLITGEAVAGEVMILQVNKTTWNNLRNKTDGIHNQLCDVLFYTTNERGLGINGNGVLYSSVRGSATFVGTEGDLYKIKLTFNADTGNADSVMKLVEVTA